ncbi:MAG: hypothetical protein PHQ64_04095, partial [Bacilli bacterium]|nr:hypothetical protein [Bacilli bacterium]
MNLLSMNKTKIIFTLLFSLFITIILNSSYDLKYKKDYIIIKNGSSNLIISEIILDGVKLQLNNDFKEDNEYNLYNNKGYLYITRLLPFTEFKVNIRNVSDIKINFKKEGNRKFYFINGKYHEIEDNLYNSGYKASSIKINIDTYNYNNDIKVFSISKFIFTLSFLFIISSILVYKFNLISLLPILLISLYPLSNMSFSYKLILLLLLLFLINLPSKDNEKKNSKLLVIIFSIISSFSIMGNYIINYSFNISTFISFILVIFIIYILTNKVINFIDRFKDNIVDKIVLNKRLLLHKLLLMIIIIAISLIYHYIFYPYIITADGHMQIEEMLSNNISDWHPYTHTLFMYIFYLLFGNFKIYIYFRILLLAEFLSNILIYFVKRGMKLKYMYLFTVLFISFPVTGINIISIVKDVDFSICLLYLSFLFYLIFNDYNYFRKNKLNYLYFTLTILGVALFRHNSYYVILILLVIMTIYFFIKGRKYLFFAILISSSLIFSFKVPIYKELKIYPNPRNIKSAFMLHGFNKLIVEDKDLIDKDFYNYLINKVPLIEWKNIYDKNDIDLMLHYSNSSIKNINFDNSLIFSNYIKQFIKSPIPLIVDRLNGSNLIWQV